MIFSPTVCHRHISTLHMAGRGDSTGWTVGFEPQWGQDIFSFSYLYGPALGPTQPYVPCELPTFLGVQQLGHGADHPSPSSADIKNQ